MINRLSKLAISILFYIGHKTYMVICKLYGKYIPPSLVILTYHPIKASDAEKFEKQMNMLLNSGRPISLNGDISSLHSGNNIAVTFDDAFQSVLQNALPILSKKNIPATIFVPTGYLGKKPGWIKISDHPYVKEIVVTNEQLKVLPYDLITLGSHSVSHINLTHNDEHAAVQEIFESKKALEQIINKEVRLFAAPYATLNEKFIPLFREAGFERVFLNIPTFPATKTDLYILGRTSVEPTDWPIEYRLKLSGAYQWLPLAISLKNKFKSSDKAGGFELGPFLTK